MQFAFTVQRGTDVNLIRACSAREITVREHVIRRSVVLSPADIVFDWPPASPADLTAEHLQAALALQPEVILLGTGDRQYFPDPKVLAAVYSAGVGVEIMDTPAACRTYNVLVQDGRRVVAALIIEGERQGESREQPGLRAGEERVPGEDTGDQSVNPQPFVAHREVPE